MPTKNRRRLRWYECLLLFAAFAGIGTLGDYLFFHQLNMRSHIVGGAVFATLWTLLGVQDKKSSSRRSNHPK